MKQQQMVRFGMMVAVAAIMAFVENMIPLPLPVPGVRLGLANMVSVVALHGFPGYTVIGLVVARCVLAGWMSGTLVVMAGSLAGGIISTGVLVMIFRRCRSVFSLRGMSAVAGALHPVAQLAVYALLPGMQGLVVWMPVLLTSGLLAGWIIGWFAEKIVIAVPAGVIAAYDLTDEPEVEHDQDSGA